MKKWLCDICGYLAEGDNAPKECPRCKTPKFILQEDDRDVTNVSLFSREVSGIMKLDSLLVQVLDAAEKMAKTNTCNNCTTILNQTKMDVSNLKQLTKDEIKKHITKGNWG